MPTRVSECLKQYREERAYTQTALAEAIGVASNAISKMEHGVRRMSLEEAVSIAEVLSITLEDLAGIERTSCTVAQDTLSQVAHHVRQGHASLHTLSQSFLALETLLLT